MKCFCCRDSGNLDEVDFDDVKEENDENDPEWENEFSFEGERSLYDADNVLLKQSGVKCLKFRLKTHLSTITY